MFDRLRHCKTEAAGEILIQKTDRSMDLEVKERMRRFFFSKKKIVVSEKHMRAVHQTRNQIGVA